MRGADEWQDASLHVASPIAPLSHCLGTAVCQEVAPHCILLSLPEPWPQAPPQCPHALAAAPGVVWSPSQICIPALAKHRFLTNSCSQRVDPKSYMLHQIYPVLPELLLAAEGLPGLCAHSKPLFTCRRCYTDTHSFSQLRRVLGVSCWRCPCAEQLEGADLWQGQARSRRSRLSCRYPSMAPATDCSSADS